MSLRRLRRVLGCLVLAICLSACTGITSGSRAKPSPLLTAGAVPLPVPAPLSAAEAALELAEMRAAQAALSPARRALIARWDRGAVLHWNSVARELVAANEADPLTASRMYALLSLAQYDALRLSALGQQRFKRQLPDPAESGVQALVAASSAAYPSEHAALAAASAAILEQFFPNERARLNELRAEHQESRLWAGVNCRSDLLAGDGLGRAIAAEHIAREQAAVGPQTWDGSGRPLGPGYWQADPVQPRKPMLPLWGSARPWLLERGDQFRLPPPPAFGSPEFKAALAEVRQFADTLSPEQLAIAKHWADGKGTPTPPGHWNALAVELIADAGLDNREAARILAYLNMALMDAGIAAWDSKYAYWLVRPSQADPAIVPVVKLPDHPSYPSGHATFSGAAAAFLGAVFPAEQSRLARLADEAALSRVYGGIHYRFDGDRGLELGRAVGKVAAARFADDSRP
jgi:membrane-associated phospholipid phosphatase